MSAATRRPGAGRWIALAALLLAAALAAYWWWSPHLALRQMQAAAQAHDAQKLSQYVDYPRLRESMKSEFSARMTQKMQGAKDNPVAAFGMSLGLMMAGGLVEALVRPEVLMQALETGRIAAAVSESTVPPDPATPATGAPRWAMEREGADRVLVYPARDGKADRERLGFVLDRSGFARWTLTGVRLPAF
jgi:hypothetical protein